MKGHSSSQRDPGCAKFSRFITTLNVSNYYSTEQNTKNYKNFQAEKSLLCMIGLQNWDFKNFPTPQSVIYNLSRDFPATENCTDMVISCYFEDLLQLLIADESLSLEENRCYNYLEMVKKFRVERNFEGRLILSFTGEFGEEKELFLEKFWKHTHSEKACLAFIDKFARFVNRIGFDGIYIQYSTSPIPSGLIVKNWLKQPWNEDQESRICDLSNSIGRIRMNYGYKNLTFILGTHIKYYSGLNRYACLRHFDLIAIELDYVLEPSSEFIKNHDLRIPLSLSAFVDQIDSTKIPTVINVDTFGHINYAGDWSENEKLLLKLSFGTCNLFGSYRQLPYYWVTYFTN